MHTAVVVYEAANAGEDFVIREFNRAAERFESIARESVVGRSVQEVFPGVREFGIFEVFRRVWKTGTPEYHPMGQYRDNRISGWRENYVYRLPGGNVVAVYDDITERKKAEEALMESEKRYRIVTELTSDYIFRISVDRDGNPSMDYISEGYSALTGRSAGEVKSMEQWAGIINPDDYPAMMDALRGLILSGGRSRVECRSTVRGGGEHVVRITQQAERDGTGRVAAVIGSVQDITAQRTAEEQLRRSEEKYRMIVETASEGIFTIDPRSMVTFVNRRMAEMLGYGPEEIVGRNSQDFVFEEDREIQQRRIESRRTGNADPYEHRYRRRDGSELWAIVSPRPLFDPGGEFAGSFAMVTDITERKVAARMLQEQNILLQTLLDTIPSPIFYKDGGGVYTGCNREFEELMGKGRDEIVGKTVFELSPRDIAERYREMDELLLKNPGVQRYEWKIRDGAGKVRDVVFHKASFIGPGGKVAGIVGIISDITGRKKMEGALMGSLTQKEALLREVHHRVKNNLQMIISILEQRSQHLGDGPLQDQFQDIISRVRAMSFIHEGLYQSDNAASINIREFIEQLSHDVLRGYRGDAGAVCVDVRGPGIEVPLEQALPLGLLMNEILTNSVKHAFPGGFQGKAEITVTIGKGDDRVMVFVMGDNGVGMPDSAALGKGPTLGMTLLPMLARQLGGELSLRRGGGTFYTLSFPGMQGPPVIE
jgi:PAS domain S-box-containing protein